MFPWGCNRPVYRNTGHRLDAHRRYALILESCGFEGSAFILVRLLGPFLPDLSPKSLPCAFYFIQSSKRKERRWQRIAFSRQGLGGVDPQGSWEGQCPDQTRALALGSQWAQTAVPILTAWIWVGCWIISPCPHFIKCKRRLIIISIGLSKSLFEFFCNILWKTLTNSGQPNTSYCHCWSVCAHSLEIVVM